MISLEQQTEYNNTFNTKFNTLINKEGINTLQLLEHFNTFEKDDVDDEIFKTILKSMLNIPYYKNLMEINVLDKFRVLQHKLKSINSKIQDEQFLLRLDDIINK